MSLILFIKLWVLILHYLLYLVSLLWFEIRVANNDNFMVLINKWSIKIDKIVEIEF
jgi:hypothetical protein